MEAQAIVEAALQALVTQDAAAHARWFDERVRFEAPPAAPLEGKSKYLKMMAPALAPGSGARVYGFKIVHAEAAGQPIRWVRVALELRSPRRGPAAPADAADHIVQESDTWYGVEGDRIVHVKAFSKAHEWHFSAP